MIGFLSAGGMSAVLMLVVGLSMKVREDKIDWFYAGLNLGVWAMLFAGELGKYLAGLG